MDRKNPGGDRTDLYHLFVKTSRQEKKRGRAGLILRSFWDKNEIFHRVYIIDSYNYRTLCCLHSQNFILLPNQRNDGKEV